MPSKVNITSPTAMERRVILFALIVFLGCVSMSQSKIRNCGGLREYDDRTELCCNGEVNVKLNNHECCGRKVEYNPSVSICCGDQVHDRYRRDEESGKRMEQQCCGGDVVPMAGFLCCSDNPLQLTKAEEESRDSLLCCSAQRFANLTFQFCCGGMEYSNKGNVECCNDKIMVTDHSWCRDDVILPLDQNICGGKKYNVTTSSCCMNEINSKIPEILNGSCCGTVPYNKSAERCCESRDKNGALTTLITPKSFQCCGNTSIDPAKQDCIEHENVPGPKSDNGMEWCGLTTYNPSSDQDCCDGKLFNKSTNSCCQGDYEANIIPLDSICCNGRELGKNEMCCYGNICPMQTENDDDCCMNWETDEIKTFCHKTQACNGMGQVVWKPEGSELCGDRSTYFPETEICCRPNKASKARGYNDCCGENPFNTRTQQCCDYTVYDFPIQERKCCVLDGNIYRDGDTSNPCLRKCGTSFYDPDTHDCCSGKVYKIRAGRECCGEKYINLKKRECCGDVSLRKGRFGCCDDMISYNKATHACCTNRLTYRTEAYSCEDGMVMGQGDNRLGFNKTAHQMLCHRDVRNRGDMMVEAMCSVTSKDTDYFVIKGFFKDVKRTTKRNGIYQLDLWLSITADHRNGTFHPVRHETERTLTILIDFSTHNDWKCRTKSFEKLKNKEVVLISRKTPWGKILKIGQRDFIYMTKLSKLKRTILTQVNTDFCQHVVYSSGHLRLG